MTDLNDVRLVWGDVESTGLEPRQGSKLIQVAFIVTDGHLNPLHEGFETKVYYSADEVEAMKAEANEFVREMHTVNGLWDALPVEGLPLAEAERAAVAYLTEHVGGAKKAKLCGNSITLDRVHLNTYMPAVGDYLHYRSIDMSSVEGLFELTRPEVPHFKKKLAHEALEDIRESLAQGRYYADILRNFS